MEQTNERSQGLAIQFILVSFIAFEISEPLKFFLFQMFSLIQYI